MTPSVIAYDPENHLLILEDLGQASDFSFIYQYPRRITLGDLTALATFLSSLHGLSAFGFPANMDMKQLNHAHIFDIPFRPYNGLDLDHVQLGLAKAAIAVTGNAPLKTKVDRLGQRYLSTGQAILHGDYYPGSWLYTEAGIKVIDPEFAFAGDKEFDLGVTKAHLLMAGVESELISGFFKAYGAGAYDHSLMEAYAGVEILRRLFGVAQLPLNLSVEEKKQLTQRAIEMIGDV